MTSLSSFSDINYSNSTRFDTIEFTSGEDQINLAAFGALAFLRMTSSSTSVPAHTVAWIYNPANNETIVYVIQRIAVLMSAIRACWKSTCRESSSMGCGGCCGGPGGD